MSRASSTAAGWGAPPGGQGLETWATPAQTLAGGSASTAAARQADMQQGAEAEAWVQGQTMGTCRVMGTCMVGCGWHQMSTADYCSGPAEGGQASAHPPKEGRPMRRATSAAAQRHCRAAPALISPVQAGHHLQWFAGAAWSERAVGAAMQPHAAPAAAALAAPAGRAAAPPLPAETRRDRAGWG